MPSALSPIWASEWVDRVVGRLYAPAAQQKAPGRPDNLTTLGRAGDRTSGPIRRRDRKPRTLGREYGTSKGHGGLCPGSSPDVGVDYLDTSTGTAVRIAFGAMTDALHREVGTGRKGLA